MGDDPAGGAGQAGAPADSGERRVTFTRDHVERFAAAGGDRNPLHVDAGFARRTPFGAPIVHGALLTIGMLGAIPPESLAGIGIVRAWFAAPLMVGDAASVSVRPSRRSAGAGEVRVTGRGRVLARLLAAPAGAERAPQAAPAAAILSHPMRSAPAEPERSELTPGATTGGAYVTRTKELQELAAALGAGRLDPALLEGLAWASYVVGMEVPGMHSLFSAVTLTALAPRAPGAPAVRHSLGVREHDPRTGRILIDGTLYDVDDGARVGAVIECFARAPAPAPDPQLLAAGAEPATDPGSVVVIGGSRGFGAALSLALLARGYTVHVAYSGLPESAAELTRLAGGGADRLALHRLDAGDPIALTVLGRAIEAEGTPLKGLVLNAALPPLPMGVTAESGLEVADYVAGSLRLAAVPLGALLPLLGEGSWVVFSSSSALAAPPRDWPHYVSAKGALEGLARWLAAAAPATAAVILRPPAMRTEMTNTPTGRIAAAPVETIAARLADQLARGELPTGLSVLEPESREVAPR
jgi:NAD(P)-dependent dehydrogenase (short-subunit alcohol dehydrogenase family)/acyl dehydratase